MRRFLNHILLALAACCMLAACSETEDTYTPYSDWEVRNAAWYLQITDSARTAIAQAKAQYGDDWEAHCQWRQIKSLQKQKDYNSGLYTDSICVRILERGEGTESPAFSDTVRLSMRGWLMPATYKRLNNQGQEVDSLMQEVFTQSYYGDYDSRTAAPQKMAVSGTIEGFQTALQYMVAGDDWLVYIPYTLAYGESGNSSIPGYSTLQFRLQLTAVYPVGQTVPDWK